MSLRVLAVSLVNSGPEKDWIDSAFRRCFGRPATADEVKKLTAFLDSQSKLLADRKAKGDDIGVLPGLAKDADPVRARALADVRSHRRSSRSGCQRQSLRSFSRGRAVRCWTPST